MHYPYLANVDSCLEQEIEGIFHCLMAVQEAVPVEDNVHLRRLFSPNVLNRLPSSGNDRIRRTVVILIGVSPLNYSRMALNTTVQGVIHHGSPRSQHTHPRTPTILY